MRKSNSKEKTLMIVIALLCFFPIFLAGLFHHLDYRFPSWGRTNYGQLIEENLSLETVSMQHIKNGSRFISSDLAGRFALLYIAPFHCDLACQNELYLMQQIQIALGAYQDRLLKFIIVSSETNLPTLPNQILDPEAFLISTQVEKLQNNHLYLMDPAGKMILWYPLPFEGKKVLQDVKHLIKLSSASR